MTSNRTIPSSDVVKVEPQPNIGHDVGHEVSSRFHMSQLKERMWCSHRDLLLFGTKQLFATEETIIISLVPRFNFYNTEEWMMKHLK